MNEDVKNPVVSRHYRAIADEKAPDALNQAVLRKARQQSARRYSRSVLWLRPMAWAASIGLCLAVVIELNNVPGPEPSLAAPPATVPAPARSAVTDEETPDAKLSTAAAIEEPAKTEEQVANEAESGLLPNHLEQRARKTVDADGRVNLDDIAQLEKSKAGSIVGEQRRDELTAIDGPLLEEIESLARMREGDNASENPVNSPDEDTFAGAAADVQETKQVGIRAFSAATAPAMELAVSAACEPPQRETPEAWLECVEGLETDGMTNLAQREREQLREAFPDFDMP